MNKQRQIKLRVWSKDAEKYFYDPANVYGTLQNSKYDEWANDYKDMVWQQCVDLKDKNGKDIYEGDRVKFGYTENHDFFGEVVWFDDRASFGVVTGNAFKTFEDLMDYMQYFEVVGNIFESPCIPDHNVECLVCDEPLDGCPFLKEKYND
jgi:uncharacterized phage protein (TIGR01671 family)